MRKILLGLLLLGLAASLSFSDLSFSGQANLDLSLFPVLEHDAGRFESPLNPGNVMEVRDLNLGTGLHFKLSSQEQKSAFAFWAAVRPYDLARALLAASSGSAEQEAAVAGALSLLGPPPSALEILRAYVQWYLGPEIVVTLGRQSMLTGYGYGWNPMDFVSPAKDPSDPNVELVGVDALSVQYSPGNILIVKLAGLYRCGSSVSGVDLSRLQGAAEITVWLPSLEIKLTGLFKQGAPGSDDPFVPAVGAGFMADLAGLGLYAEAALLKGSRIPIADVGGLHWPSGWFFDALLGLQHTFPSELSLTAEYFYNGEGYSQEQRREYREALDFYNNTEGAAPAQYLTLFRPGYFAKHYLGLSLQLPVYALAADVGLTALYSPDSQALSLLPSLAVDLSGSLTVSLSYAGMFSLREGRFDEASLAPVRHEVKLSARYDF